MVTKKFQKTEKILSSRKQVWNTFQWMEVVEKNKKSMTINFYGENFSIFRDIGPPKFAKMTKCVSVA